MSSHHIPLSSSSVPSSVASEAAPRKLRGFAAIKARGDLAFVREVASRGGRAAHEQRVAHTWTRESAAAAGRKGAASREAKRHALRDTRHDTSPSSSRPSLTPAA